MRLLRIDLEMNVWVVPFCGFGIRTTNIKNGSSTDVEIKALGISDHRTIINIQTFMSVGYLPKYKDGYRDKPKYKEKLRVTYSFNLLMCEGVFNSQS